MMLGPGNFGRCASLVLLAAGCSTTAQTVRHAPPSSPAASGVRPEPLQRKTDWYEKLLAEVPSDDTLSGYALLWYDAELFATPDPAANLSRRAEAAERYTSMKDRFPVAIVRDGGTFLEVRNLGLRDRGEHCGFESSQPAYSAMLGEFPGLTFSGYDLRMFVRRRDIVPVLGAQYADSNEDGSSILLAAGTPVEPNQEALGVRVRSRWFPIYTVPVDLDLSYELAAIPEPEGGLYDRCDESAKGRLLGQRVSVGDVSGSWTPRCSIEESDDGEQLRVILQDRCARLEMMLDEDPRPRAGAGGLGTIGSRPSDIEHWTVQAGTAVFWRDGTLAGTKRTTETTAARPEVVGALSCWSLGADLQLCHKADQVEYSPGEAGPAGEPGTRE